MIDDPLTPEERLKVDEAIQRLTEEGLVEPTPDGFFQLTEKGWFSVRFTQAVRRRMN